MKVTIKALVAALILLNGGFALTGCSGMPNSQIAQLALQGVPGGSSVIYAMQQQERQAEQQAAAKEQARLQAIEDAKPLAQKQAEAAQKQAEEAATRAKEKEIFNGNMRVIDQVFTMDAAMHGETTEQALQRYNQESKESLQRQKDYRLECNLRYTDSRQRGLCYARYSS